MRPPPDPDRVIALTVVDRQVVAHDQDVVALTLAATDGRPLPRWHPGAHLDIHLPSGRLRQYSLCGRPRRHADTYRIAVRRIGDGGGGSIEVHDELSVGATVTTHGPRNAFPLTVPGYGSPTQRFRFIAGGIGITPILPMLALAERLGVDWSMVYAGRSRDSLPFIDEVTPLRRSHRDPHRRRERRADRRGTPRRLRRRHHRLRVRPRADVDGRPRRAGRTRQRRAAFRAVRRATGRRRPRVHGVDRFDRPGSRGRRRRDAADGVATRRTSRRPTHASRGSAAPAGRGWWPEQSTTATHCSPSRSARRHDAGLHFASRERGATHSRFVARLYYSAMPLAAGQTFAGYTIVRLLGSGGMGEVYLAEHPRLPRRDALKVLRNDVCADEEYRRDSTGSRLAATLWHPHIVGVHDRGDVDGQIWISMDYVDGTDAGELLRDRYPKGMPKRGSARTSSTGGRRGARLRACAGPAAPRRQARQHHADRLRAAGERRFCWATSVLRAGSTTTATSPRRI